MQNPQNQAVIKVWENKGVNCVEVDAQIACDDHGLHHMKDTFAVPSCEAYSNQGLWLAFVLYSISARWPVEV